MRGVCWASGLDWSLFRSQPLESGRATVIYGESLMATKVDNPTSKWALPAYEQGALPTLSLLPGEVSVRVLPGDKMYQAMTIEPHYMRPVILHGFGSTAKKRMPSSLAELAQFGWLPLAAALFGTQEWKPQWLHPNFLPVVGLRLHASCSSLPSSTHIAVWTVATGGTIGTFMYIAAAGSSPHVWSSTTLQRDV